MSTDARNQRKWKNRNFRLMVRLGWYAHNGGSRDSEYTQRIMKNSETTFRLRTTGRSR